MVLSLQVGKYRLASKVHGSLSLSIYFLILNPVLSFTLCTGAEF